MSTNLITGYAGKAHITSGGDGAVNAALFGKGRYVLDIGERFSYEIISNNLIRIKSGYAINQGRKIELSVNDYEELIIDNGLQGVKRCDLIAVTYEKNLETGIETAVMNVIKGTSGDDYLDPEHTVGNILKGDAKDDFLLYRVKINGLSIESVEKLFEVRKSLIESDTAENTTAFTSSDVADGSASAWTNVSKLSSGEKHSSILKKVSQMFKNVRYLYKMLGTTDISGIGNGTCTGAISSLNSSLGKCGTFTTLGEWHSASQNTSATITIPDISQYRYILLEGRYGDTVRDSHFVPSHFIVSVMKVYDFYFGGAHIGSVKFNSKTSVTFTQNDVTYAPMYIYGVY